MTDNSSVHKKKETIICTNIRLVYKRMYTPNGIDELIWGWLL